MEFVNSLDVLTQTRVIISKSMMMTLSGSKRLMNRQIPSVRSLASVVSEDLPCQFLATLTFSE